MEKILIQIKEEEDADENEYNRTKIDKRGILDLADDRKAQNEKKKIIKHNQEE